MADKAVFLTPEGKKKLEEELEYLRSVKRLQVAQRIRAAKEDGDVMENVGYDDAKNEQAFLEGRILTIESILKNAVLIEEEGPSDRVRLGSRVTVVERDGEPETFRIVGSAEADPSNGLISNESPLGKALLGHEVGEEVAVNTPGGLLYFTIVEIR
ncbi:MAG TPA: transcription elongation factor GreA [Anaerolineae bacterium]|nr:transcription elongation factor GreA [Anaerolineae bacterium]